MNKESIIFWVISFLLAIFCLLIAISIFMDGENAKAKPTMAEKIIKACGKKFKVDDWDILQPGEVIVTCYNPKNYQIHGVIVHYTPQ